jgi:hypothetical protein
LNSGLFQFLYEDYQIVYSLLDDESLELILKLIQKKLEQYTSNWIDVFLVKYLFNRNRYEILTNISRNQEIVDLPNLLKQLSDYGQIFTYVELSPDDNISLIRVSIRERYNPSGEWTLEGELDIKDKLIKITALNKKNKYISNPIKPIEFPTSDKDQNERND